MLTRKPEQPEGVLTMTRPPAFTIDSLPAYVPPTPKLANALIPREQLAGVPVPEGFDTTNLSTINKGGWERAGPPAFCH